MRTGRTAALAAPALALALAATACSGGDVANSLDEIPAADINAQDRRDVRDGGTLRWGTHSAVSQYMMHHTEGNLGDAHHIMGALMPSPFAFDENGEVHNREPYLRDYEVSDDGRELRMELNPDARWSNGDPITWEDYEQQAMTLGGKEEGDFDAPGQMHGYDRIDSVERGDSEYDLTVRFSEPFGEIGLLFEHLYPKEVMADPDRFNEDYLEDVPITAGPFEFESLDAGSGTVTVVRNDDWWGEPAKLDEIIFQPGDPAAQAGAFVNDELDTFYVGYEAAEYSRVQDRPDGRVTQAVDNGFRFLEMNADTEELSDVDVRHAVTLALDRSEMAAASLEAIDWPDDPTANRLLRSSSEDFQENSGDLGEQDVERANQLLEEAGWSLGDGDVRTNAEGDRLTLRFFCPTGVRSCTNEATIAQDHLSEVGIDVSVEKRGAEEYFNEHIYTGDFELSTFAITGSTPYVGEMFENFGGPFDEDGEDWGYNNARTSTPEINEKFDELAVETDRERYNAIANEIDALMWQNGQSIPLFQRPGTWAVPEDLANFGAFGLASIVYEDIGFVRQ
ncbi:ABC transporter family substrate-binding protein [Halostreptopolyspora alba]|uniref:ABC transporter family substrate-binding protein n=1 Tax=Halostreptopolyspora alba TaxID=2487137 RepID=A0A3N0E6M5_9ACTN|nr:ABC transporter family substrate-binding protein [Nocardiopsaceae bacterium YIM 96095]